MSGTDDSATEGEYGVVEVNDRGRLTIPKELRDDLQIEGGTRFTVVREGGDIRLVRRLPELQTLSSGRSDDEWGEEAFRDAGEATFGGQ
jgi:AbrB family looped-hinge helix DNA binding protein